MLAALATNQGFLFLPQLCLHQPYSCRAGNLKIKCVASVHHVYHRSNEVSVEVIEQHYASGPRQKPGWTRIWTGYFFLGIHALWFDWDSLIGTTSKFWVLLVCPLVCMYVCVFKLGQYPKCHGVPIKKYCVYISKFPGGSLNPTKSLAKVSYCELVANPVPLAAQVRNNPATPPLEVGSPVAADDGAYYGGELGPRLARGGGGAVSSRAPVYVISGFLLIVTFIS